MRNKILIAGLFAVLLAVIFVVIFSFGGSASSREGSRSFFQQFVVAGGPIVWFVLLPMSVLTVCLAIEHSLSIRKGKLLPEDITARIVEKLGAENPKSALAESAEQGDLVSTAVARALSGKGGDWFRIRGLLTESLQEQAHKLMRKIEWLNLLGSVSPMVGLFGTVFGMIKLFNSVVMAGGQPQPAQLAGGISVALVTTFWGLLIAIPSLAIHGIFRQRIETIASDAVVELENISPYLKQYVASGRKNPSRNRNES
jgi:biopolymer transport protein ExbB